MATPPRATCVAHKLEYKLLPSAPIIASLVAVPVLPFLLVAFHGGLVNAAVARVIGGQVRIRVS